MTIEIYIQNIQRWIESIPEGQAEIILEAANNATGMIKDRIRKTGCKADGSMFAPYSTTPMLTNCSSMTQAACAKKAGSKEKRRDLRWVTLKRGDKKVKLFELEGGYKEYRELHGRPTNFVDFAFSGNMWADVQVTSNDNDHRKGRATVSALHEDQYKKLEGNEAKREGILDISEAEMNDLAGIIENRLIEMMQRSDLA